MLCLFLLVGKVVNLGEKFLDGVLPMKFLLGVRRLLGVAEDLLADLLRILVVEVAHLQLGVMAIFMQAMQTLILLPLVIFPLLDKLSEEVPPRCLAVTRALLDQGLPRQLKGQGYHILSGQSALRHFIYGLN